MHSSSKTLFWSPLYINGNDTWNQATSYVVKILFWRNRNGSSLVFKSTDVLELAINHKSDWEFQLIVSETLVHHNQGCSRNLHFEFFLSIWFLGADNFVQNTIETVFGLALKSREYKRNLSGKEIMLWRFYINKTGCVRITGD